MTTQAPPRTGVVCGVHRSATHSFSKPTVDEVRLLEGIGVEGDAHSGATVRHRSRVQRDPHQPNLRQVHLIHSELYDEFAAAGFDIAPGELGENITTTGIALLSLPVGTLLRVGDEALLSITGLRNPCRQIEDFRPGLLALCVGRDESGEVVRKAGVMSVVLRGGVVRAGDRIEVALPPLPHQRLEKV